MKVLQNFRQKSFVEQITLLNDIGKQGAVPAHIQELVQLFLTPVGDKPVDAMVRHTLNDLLSKDEVETVKLLGSADAQVRRLCLQVIGKRQYQSAVPVLLELVNRESEPGLVYELFFTMTRLKNPEFLPVFRSHLDHVDELVAALCIGIIGEYKDESQIPRLMAMVNEAEVEGRYLECSVPTAKAVETLATFETPGVIEFLVARMHHKNPTARRMIHEELVKMGLPAIPYIARVFETGSLDERILAANLLGLIGHKKGGEVLIEVLDRGKAGDANLKFAIYEAFGLIQFMKGLVCLNDGLLEKDPLMLICVVTALEKQLNTFVADRVKVLIKENSEQGQRLAQAIVVAKAVKIFAALYTDEMIANQLVEVIAHSSDMDVIDTFLEKIRTLDTSYRRRHEKKMTSRRQSISLSALKVLAVDDSRSMLSFYRKVLSDMGLSVETAENGNEALSLVEREEPFRFGFKLVITDMNMPGMDGIEFTRKVREKPHLKELPIIMVTTESESSQRQLATHVGVSDFITKPATAEIFSSKIKRYLSLV